MRDSYNPKEHSLVRRGKRREDEILGDFIDILEYHFSLLNEKMMKILMPMILK
jgi:hypothetical protein